MRITRDLIRELGPTPNCVKCTAIANGDAGYETTAHMEACRERAQQYMHGNSAYQERLQRAEEKSRRFTIFLLSGSLPDRIYLVGLGSDSNSYCRDLALQADRDTDGSEFDKRVEAKDSVGRPLWAKGAIVLVGSAESRRLHTALEACSIVLDCRYVVVPEACASRAFVSMASMAEQGSSSRDVCRRKVVVNKMRSITVDPENIAEHEEYAVWQRHKFFQELMQWSSELPEDAEIAESLRGEREKRRAHRRGLGLPAETEVPAPPTPLQHLCARYPSLAPTTTAAVVAPAAPA